jgi:hypothetical protein
VARGELAGPIDPTIAHLLLLGSLAAGLYIIDLTIYDTTLPDLATATAAGITALADRHRSDPNGVVQPH